ncbi:transcription initiation factor TFIID subunit 6-like isoform X1 [Amaranthus tricolor]|uniref:transcription initiation factor TFIID subunit 6-like isoform X1 n=1 Tax=Amaranthus tricolor TaxID=29722 RepID=UPI002582654B|nr:transcription initiation factor TFIID subunit 6-like isoform X1 [Amaranthus tricolor]
MSIVQKETIEVIAQSIGITNLSPDVASTLAPDVEYRVREIMQEAIKCMRHSKRTILTADDVDAALRFRNVEPIYGFASNDPLRFKRAAGHKDLFYVNDVDLDLKDVTEAPLPRAPLDTSISVHWLAIEGVQPAIPENPPPSMEALAPLSDGKKLEYKEEAIPIDIKFPVKHVLSKELQLYFDKVLELTTRNSDTLLFKKALRSLATDPGLHPLVPYFACFIADELQVSRNLRKLSLLFGLMHLVCSLLQNPHIHIEPYVHQLMPSVITCMVTKRLGNRYSDNHWELRNFAANLVARICQRFGHVYHNLQPRITRTLLHVFLDPKKTWPQHYGAIQGLAALGPSVVRMLILPNLEPYMQLLVPEMQLEGQKNEIKRQEAWQVYGALLFASGKCMHDLLKKFPSLPLPLAKPFLKSNMKIAAMRPNKRKASMDNLLQQPPFKKLSSDGSMGVMPTNSMQGVGGGFTSGAVTGSDAGFSNINQQLQNENVSGSNVKREKIDVQAQKASALALAWKEETDGGRLSSSLFEHFGLSMFSFIPSPELSSFL